MNVKKIGLALIGVLLALLGLGWLGLQIPPKPTVKSDNRKPVKRFLTLPADWPEPVKRHYGLAFGLNVPEVTTAVVFGRARFYMGLWMPMRFSAYHLLGQNFLRQMEVTWFNIPFLTGEDTYINGKGCMNIRGNKTEGFKIDQGENLVMWSEALLFPSVINGRARWEAIDETSARLIIPFKDGEETATVYFDPVTGFMRRLSAMRFKDIDGGKILWHVDYLNWKSHGAIRFPEKVKVTWEDDGFSWFIGEIDDVMLNVTLPDKLLPNKEAWKDWTSVLAESAALEAESV